MGTVGKKLICNLPSKAVVDGNVCKYFAHCRTRIFDFGFG